MRRRRHVGVRSARGYLESPKRPGRARVGFGLINARIPGGQRSSACISSRITTVIRVTVGATKGTITDLMSHSQFHCHVRVYLDMHGLIFETSICYWQDQPGSRRSCAGSEPAEARQWGGPDSGSPSPPRGGAGEGNAALAAVAPGRAVRLGVPLAPGREGFSLGRSLADTLEKNRTLGEAGERRWRGRGLGRPGTRRRTSHPAEEGRLRPAARGRRNATARA